MIFFKKSSNNPCIEYDEALDEALCFGWIDSIIKKLDDDRYLRKFTPRTNVSKWSDLNKRKVMALIENNRMTEAGLSKIDIWLRTGKVNWEGSRLIQEEDNFQEPEFIHEALAENEPALTNFRNLASTYRKHYILWITNAHREDTKRRRLNEAIDLLKENKKLGLK